MTTRIRTAAADDARERMRIGDRAPPDPPTVRETRHGLVLDAPDGGLAAAMLVSFDRAPPGPECRAQLSLLAIAPRFEGAPSSAG